MKKFNLLVLTVFCVMCFIAPQAMAADVNLTSLGKTDDGRTVWRLTNNTDTDQVVKLESYGNGTVGYFGVPAGEYRAVYSPYADGSATHKLYTISGDVVTKASSQSLWEPSIENIAFKNGVPIQEAERLLANGVITNQNNIATNSSRLDSQGRAIAFNYAVDWHQKQRLDLYDDEIYNTADENNDGLMDGDGWHVNGDQTPVEPEPEIVLMAEPNGEKIEEPEQEEQGHPEDVQQRVSRIDLLEVGQQEQAAAAAAEAAFVRQEMDKLFEKDKDLSAGIAGVGALASLQFAPNHPGLQVAIGAFTYDGESAGALGVGGRITKKVFVNGNVSYDSRENFGVGAGLTFMFK